MLLLAASALALALAAPSAALGACDNWTNKSGGSWNEASNWSEGVPGPSTEVCIQQTGTYEVTLEPSGSAGVYVKSLKLGSTSGAQTLRILATSAAKGAYLRAYEEVSVGSRGTVDLGGTPEYESGLEAASDSPLENAGTINAEASEQASRWVAGAVSNTGRVNVSDHVTLIAVSGSTFTNGNGGMVAGAGSGHLALVSGATFVQGAGKTEGSAPVVTENGATVEYAGSGESHVIARDYTTYLKGALSAGQTLTIEGGCGSSYAEVRVPAAATNAGTIILTSGGCSAEAELAVETGKTLTNTGTIQARAGAGGTRGLGGTVVNKGTIAVASEATAGMSGTLTNEHVVELADKATLKVPSGAFANASGGSVTSAGSGHVAVTGGTFAEGAGTTSGTEPVVIENGGAVEYAGSGESHVIARDYTTYLKGALSAGQTLTIEGGCGSSYAEVRVPAAATNAGTIILTSGGCSAEAELAVETGKTLTNTGTIQARVGAGGTRGLGGTVVNKGTIAVASEATAGMSGTLTNEHVVELADKATLKVPSGVFANASGGSVTSAGSGHVAVTGGTFAEGAGTTSGTEPVVIENGGAVEYAGSGESHVIARDYTTYLKGALSAGQTLTIEGGCGSSYAELRVQTDVSNGGTIEITSGGCPGDADLSVETGHTLTNTGTIRSLPGAGGPQELSGAVVNQGTIAVASEATLTERGTLTNEHVVELADKGTLTASSGLFTNGSGGSVKATGSGHLSVLGTFVQGAGTTSGTEPVVIENGGAVEYAGSGESHVIARDYTTYLKGALSAGQTLTIEGNCASSYGYMRAATDVTNGGTIALRSSGCEHAAYLAVEAGHTLTNTGTIRGETGSGELRLEGAIASEGTVEDQAGASLQEYGTLNNGAHGTVKGSGSGHLSVHGTFVQGAGTTSGTEPVVIENGGGVEYAGAGESHVIARGATNYLRGTLSPGQTLTLEGNCASSYEYTRAATDVTNGGTIALRSSGCEHAAYLDTEAGHTLTNTGTIRGETGSGELRLEGAIASEGTVEDQAGASLQEYGTLNNGAHGTVKGSGSGHLSVHGTFVQGAGTTSGTEPVVVEGGTLEYTGSGESHVIARGATNYLKGSLSAPQTLTIEGDCASSYAYLRASTDVTNAGTIALHSAGCEHAVYVDTEGGHTLTNTGTLQAQAGSGGELRTEGTVVNAGRLSIDAGVKLMQVGPFTQGKAGTLRTAIASASSYGALSVSGTATLAGTIEPAPIGGFKASSGSKLVVLTATARSATFEFEKNGAIGGGLYYKPVYSSEDATLEASESPPEGLPVNTAPPHVFGTARRGHTLVLTHGTWTHAPFEYSEQWLQCNGSGGACKAISGATGTSYLLTKEDVGHTIRAQETATDSGGEGLPAQSAATAPIAELQLHADAGGSIVATVGHEATLDGSNSTPAGEIDSYRWNFGDGHSEAAGSIAHHIYEQPTNGKPLKATLTVAHGAEEATSTPIEVTVLPAPGPSEALAVTVEDDSGHQLEGAEVAYIAPGGAKTQARTEHGPALLAGLPDGTDTLYAYAPGYRPAAFKATVEGHHGTASVKLASGAPVETKLKSRELTLSEIEADGIDTSDPANRNVYDFELRLAFTHENHVEPLALSGYVNSEGEFVGGGGGGGGHLEGEEHPGGWNCTPTECEYVPAKEGAPTDWHIVAKPIVVEGHPLIQWLIIKGKASFLKQFFEVSMVIQNLSEPGFGLTAGQATINLPPGLSLAPTAEPQHAQDQVGAIPGQGSAEADWIVRGDEEGEYWPSATYESHLEPFDALVTSQAALATPMHVWGKDALELKVEGDEEGLVEGVPWHFKLGVRDKADIPLYDVELQLEEEPHANFDWQPRQPWGEMFGELKPGESVFVAEPYVVVPDGNSVEGFQPEESSATFAGEKIVKGRGITKVKRLLPVEKLAASEDSPGYVHLEWQAVPEATGYEVYSTPELTTSFANTADQVATSPGGATEATLSGTARNAYEARPQGEYRWYAVTAIVKGHRRLELNTVRAKAAEGEAEGPSGPPEIGRCVATTAGTGKYSSSKCTATGGKDAYEWLPAVEKTGVGTRLAAGSVTLETKSRFKVTCTGESSTAGGFHGAKRLEGVTLKLTGCAEASQPCTSSGANAGEIVSGALDAVVGVEKLGTSPAKDKAALSFFPPGHKGTIAAFSCASTSVVLRGAVLVPVKANKPATTQTLKFKASKGVQKPEAFAGGAAEVLEESTDGGAHYEGAGLTAALTLEAKEAVELNTAF